MSLLAVNGLVKGYPGLPVLQGLDLSVASGEVVAVRGASGTGKSTLLHCLGLLDQPDAGTIALDGEEFTALSAGRRGWTRATRIGFVFQAFNLLPEFTARENILLAARIARADSAASGGRADDLLARVGLQGRGGADVRTLSGGERQRVAICRALLLKPRLLLADEPTGNLDPATAATVLAQLTGLARQDGAAVVIVTHDPAIAAAADRRLELVGGRLAPLS